MADAIDKLVISLGLNSEELQRGLDKAAKTVSAFGDGLTKGGGAMTEIGEAAKKSGAAVAESANAAAEAARGIGEAGKRSAGVFGDALSGLSGNLGAFGARLSGIIAPFAAAFASGKLFTTFSQMGESLDVLSERTGVATDKIDAWAKANRDAGGSEAAFKGALESWTVEQGRSADDFFRMGEAVKGMTQQQAAHFMRAMGLSQDAAAVFTKFTDKAEEAAHAYQGVAMTPEQTKAARQMNIYWRQFTDQAQALGNVLAVSVLPIVNRVLSAINGGVEFVREHGRALKLVLGGLAAVISVAYVRSLLKASTLAGRFFAAFKAGMPVLQGAMTAARALTFAGMLSGMKKLIPTGATLMKVLAGVRGAFTAMNAALIANPITAVIGTVVAFALAIDDLCAFIDGGNSLIGMFLKLIGFTDEEVQAAGKSVGNFFSSIAALPERIGGAVSEAWNELKRFGGDVADFFSGLPERIWSAVADFITALPKRLGDAVSGVIDGLAAQVGPAVDRVLEGVGKKIKGAFGGIADFFGFGPDGGEASASATQGAVGRAAGPAYAYAAPAAEDAAERPQEGPGGMAAPIAAPQTAPGLMSVLGEFFSGMTRQAAVGTIAASPARNPSGSAVSNQMEFNVTNNIQTNGTPEDVGRAVGGAMDSALSRRNRMLVAAQSGVISK